MLGGGLGTLLFQCDWNGEEGAEAEAVQCPAGHTDTDPYHSQWGLANISFGVVISTLSPTDPWGFADCFWQIFQVRL